VNDDDTSTTTSFELVIIFLHHFSQPLCIVISLILLINDVRMTTFTHQLLSRKTSTPEVWQSECEFDIQAAVLRARRCVARGLCRSHFYRAMHFSAKRGIAIACRLSVCLSVCDVGELW